MFCSTSLLLLYLAYFIPVLKFILHLALKYPTVKPCEYTCMDNNSFTFNSFALDILFRQIAMIINVNLVLCLKAPDPLFHRYYKNLLIKGPGTQKQRPHELL